MQETIWSGHVHDYVDQIQQILKREVSPGRGGATYGERKQMPVEKPEKKIKCPRDGVSRGEKKGFYT